MKTVRDINAAGRRVFCRVDFNVPLTPEGRISDDTRIRAALPTIRHFRNQGARLVLASHLGRPKGKRTPEFSLAPVAERLGELLGAPVAFAPDCIGPEAQTQVDALEDGGILLLENLRTHAGEQADDPGFAAALAALCEIYVNDAFAVCHRRHASVHAITDHIAEKAGGFLLEKELSCFNQAMRAPARPLVAVVGGAKVSSKLSALRNMLDRVDRVIIGGAMANTFLKYTGLDMGTSLVEKDMLEAAGEVLQKAGEQGVRVYLPVDAVAAERFDANAVNKTVPMDNLPPGWMVLDIGPATSSLYREVLDDARTIIWNGPMGAFEMDAYSRGTFSMVETVAQAHALTVVGGGDTDTAVHRAGAADRMSFISTGGGAFLTLMEGKTLPAVAKLENV
ncbi:MAG: phosphoglycerate kinase [Desulfobacterales bacterium]|nr:MAG: phosphoglycerate kinase [Desulfobacterales bacterium]